MLRCVAALAFAVGAAALLVPFALARASHAYVGGLVWPFVADLARDYPSSIVFNVALNVLALLLVLLWALNFRRQQRFLAGALLEDAAARAFARCSRVCNAAGALGAFALPLYVLAKVATAPHRAVGEAFLFFESLACIINSYLSYQICLIKREELETGVFVTIRSAPRSVALDKLAALKKAKRGFVVELACSALFLMSLLVYFPILYKVVPPRRLTIQECLDRGYGTHYCNDSVRLDGVNTSLWNYEDDFAGFQVRAFAQLGCLLTLLTYTLSFVVSDNERYDSFEDLEKQREVTPLLTDDDDDDDASSRGRRRSRSRPPSPSKPRVRSPSGSPPKRSSYTATSPSNSKHYYISVSQRMEKQATMRAQGSRQSLASVAPSFAASRRGESSSLSTDDRKRTTAAAPTFESSDTGPMTLEDASGGLYAVGTSASATAAKFDQREMLGPSLLEVLTLVNPPQHPSQQQDAGEDASGDPHGASAEELSETPQVDPNAKFDVCLSRSAVIARVVDASVDNTRKVQEFFAKTLEKLKCEATGLVLLQDSTVLMFLETTADEFLEICRQLQTQQSVLDVASMKVLASCDDNPVRLLQGLYFRKIAVSRGASDAGEWTEDSLRQVVVETFLNLVKFVKKVEPMAPAEIRKVLTTLSNSDQMLLPPNELLLWLLARDEVMPLDEFVELYATPIALELESERVWPVHPLISY